MRSDHARTATLEAFADTIIPGEKRSPDDRIAAGAAAGGGAIAAGAIELLEWSATGVNDWLDDLARALDGHAETYAAGAGLVLDEGVPPFVALPFDDRSALVRKLTEPDHPEKPFWVMLALFSNMAYDSAAHTHTAEAIAAGHPGLTSMGFSVPDPDGRWRFAAHSYGRKLAELHPATTSSGSLA